MTAFATADDLALRLNRSFTEGEELWVTALLEDAAEFMRGVMGSTVYPSSQSTYVAYPTGGRVALPQTLIRSVDTVERDGDELVLDTDYTRRQDTLYLGCDDPVDVTFTYGLDTAPNDLISINCALVSQMMLTVSAGLGLTGAGLSSIAIDDFKAAFADAGASTGLSMTDATRNYLIGKYGTSAWVVETL